MTTAARVRSPRRLRYAGLAGTVLLAIGAYLAGAGPGAAPAGRAEALIGTGPGFRFGLLAYLCGLVLLGAAWWRLGTSLRTGAAPGLRWVLVTGAVWATPLLVAPPVGSRDVYAYACQGAVWHGGHDPYAVGAAEGGCPWLSAVPEVWQDSTAPYGPVALVAARVAVAVARSVAGTGDAQLLVAVGVLRLVAVAGAVLIAAAGPRLARACGVPPGTAAWLGLVTPLVALHVVAGAHNDALVAGLLVTSLALLLPPAPLTAPIKEKRSRLEINKRTLLLDRRDGGAGLAGIAGITGIAGIAGVGLGLAVAVKVTAVAALPFGLLLAGRRAPVAAAGALAGFGAVTLASGLGLGWAGALSGTGALGQWSSLPTGLGMAVGYALWPLDVSDTAVRVGQIAGVVALVALSAVVLARSWRRRADPRAVVAGAGVVLAAVVLLGPVVYPWYAVTPLAVLAASVTGTRARAGLAAATLVFAALVFPSGLGVPVLTKLPGAILVAAGTVALTWWWLRRRVAAGRPRAPRPARSAPAR